METTGCGTAIITPFRADGSVDEPALWALVNWQIESGIDFLVACGSTGEAATLEEEEWLNTVRIVVEAAAGRVPVWGGCTHNNTRTLVRQASLLRRIPGLSAVLSANPYYNKPTQEGQYQHFLALARAVDPLPVCGPLVAEGHAASGSSVTSASSTCSRAGRRKTPAMTIAATRSPPSTSKDVWKPLTVAGALVTATECACA